MSKKQVGIQGKPPVSLPIKSVEIQSPKKTRLTPNEKQARRSQSIRVANMGADFGMGGGFSSSGAIVESSSNAFFSPQLSSDFLELPQSEREKRELLRFYYKTNPVVGAAIDFHTDVPMSKVRLSTPTGTDAKRNKQILKFYEAMCRRVKLFSNLHEMTHQYWLQGVAFVFAEDHDLTDEIPESLTKKVVEEEIGFVDIVNRPQTRIERREVPLPDEEQDKNVREYIQKNYMGWQRLQILPAEQVKMEVFQYTDQTLMQLIPSEKDRNLIMKAGAGLDDNVEQIKSVADSIPEEIRQNIESGKPIPLNTSPYDNILCSSFCYHLASKTSFDDRGTSILERILRDLTQYEKLRQAQAMIASRAMTPKRVIWVANASEQDIDDLRDQVDQALIDPDYSIISNVEVHWDEVGARDRLLDLSSEYDRIYKNIFIGLRITESMLTGETTYGGGRINLDVMNNMYVLYREKVAEFVENYLFAPVAEKKGFFEIDEFGNKVLLYPKLKFTRLALRDNTELQDYLFNLYQKGSLPISFILELLNIDPGDTLEQLKADMFTPNDPNFNELIRAALTKIGEDLPDSSDLMERILKSLNLKSSDKKDDRFAGRE